jgi:ribA/ribD-fused uncharacterized protein
MPKPQNTDLSSLQKTVQELKDQVNEMQSTVDGISKSSNASDISKSAEGKLVTIEDKLNNMQNQLTLTEHKCNELMVKYNELNERLIKQESHSRRDNLVFTGIPEAPPGTRDDCLAKVHHIMEAIMKIKDARKMRIVRCHRLGAPPSTRASSGSHDRPRAVICKFHWFGDRQLVWEAKTKLKDSTYGVQEDFPKEILDRRKILLPIMFAARRLHYKAYLVVDRLHLETKRDGKEVHNTYDVNTLHRLPKNLDPNFVTTVRKDNVLAFFGSLCPLSNFHSAPFVIEGTKFRHVEEFFVTKKADFAEDEMSKQRIKAASTPAECKRIGSGIKVDVRRWQLESESIMAKGLFEKFDQNPKLKDFLLETGDQVLAEASPTDRFWGIGVALGGVASTKQQEWTGRNRLGQLLMELRTQLK